VITLCEHCRNVDVNTMRQNPRSWTCIRFPRLDGHGFLSETWYGKNEPFMRCEGINGGACPLFEPIAEKEKPDVLT
jgi:hypothetical protein